MESDRSLWRPCLPLICLWLIAATGAFGAEGDDANAKQKELSGPTVFVPADRTMLRWLDQARLLLEQERYVEAVRCLGAILESPEDYFFKPDKTGPVHRSLKSEAQRLLAAMPRAAAELYELQYGARARQMLHDAAKRRDLAGLTEVSRRFFHTEAGCEATFLLGLDHFDHGRWLAGALTLQRLRDTSPKADQFEPTLSLTIAACWLRCGSLDRATECLARLKTRFSGPTVVVGGKEVNLFAEPSQGGAWLERLMGRAETAEASQGDQWAIYRGNVARNASVAASGPLLSLRWRVPTTDHPFVEAMLKQLQEAENESDEWAVPGFHPLVVGDVVLMRTVENLLAVDFATGKRIWEVPTDGSVEGLLNPPPDAPLARGPQLEQALRIRMWGDATYGTLSSDGKLVFAVEDLDLAIGPAVMQGLFLRIQRQEDRRSPKVFNRLAAYDVHTGKLKWHVGGSPEELGLPLAGTFFLGPPLPLMDQLFAIAESKGEIRLLALDAKTGDLLWSQQLADVDRDVLSDPVRRLAGVSPSYADGILVCPTSNKSVVALELASRSLLWGYTYTPEATADPQVMFFAIQGMAEPNPAGRWTDASAILADGRVLITPVDSREVHCLSLSDGSLLWKQARQEDLYLACVHRGNVVLVGKRRIRAVDAASGQPAWEGRTVPLPAGTKPSGTGFLSGDLYYVPLVSGEVMAIDVAQGRIASVSRSRRGCVPGNLVCSKGMVLSQRADGLEVFYQLDALKRLVDQRLGRTPSDAAALSLRGEILWHQGKLDDALDSFRLSLQASDEPNTRDLLRDAYFDALQADFAKHRARLPEIEPLIQTPSQRATLLRLVAVGLERNGEFPAALEAYRQLIDLDRNQRALDPIDKALSVRRDRWIQSRLAALRATGSEALRAQIDQLAESQWAKAQEEGTIPSLQRFLDYFGDHPLADEARARLIEKLRVSGRLLQAELLLRRQERSADPQRAAAAVAALAELLRQAGRPRDAAIVYARLERELGDVPCLGAKTGKQVVADLPDDDPVRAWLRPPAWPTAYVEVTRAAARLGPSVGYIPFTLEYSGPRGPFFSDTVVELHHQPVQLVARDGLGMTRWQLGMAEIVGQDRFAFSRGMMRLCVEGHLMLVSMADKLLAVDTLGDGTGKAPRVLWRQESGGAASETAAGPPRVRIVVANVAGRIQRVHFSGNDDSPINLPEALSEQLVCLRQRHRCIAVDPCTGDVIWQRQDIRPDSLLFGDHTYVFVSAPGETKARVLRAADGELIGERDVPLDRLATFGRRVLVWKDDGTQGALELIDAWTGEHVWPTLPFSANAQVRLVEDEAVAVLEPEGRFCLVRLADGRIVIDAKLRAEAPMCEFLVLRAPEQYVVVVQGPEDEQPNENRHVHPIPGASSQRITRAYVYAFDRQGKPLWPSPVEVKDQFLPFDQPSQLPVLVFASMVQQRSAERKTLQTSTVILGVDKRTGQVICNETVANGSNSLALLGDPQRKTVEIQLQRDAIVLTFRDQNASTSQALWKALRRAMVGPPSSAGANAERKPPLDAQDQQRE